MGVPVETPYRIPGPKDVLDISVDLGTCALERGGGIWCWGSTVPGYESGSLLPTRIGTIDSAVAINQSQGGVCGLTQSAEIACLGAYDESLGNGESAATSEN